MTDTIPATLEDAVDTIVASLDDEGRDYILNGDNSAGGAHMGGGMAMRNQWGLWHDSVLAQHFKTRFGLGHADDMSGIILDAVYAKVRGETHDVDAQVARYKRHWARYGVDPLTQEKTGPAEIEKNKGGIAWSEFDIPDATIQRRTPPPPPSMRRTFWQKIGDAIFGPE